MGGHVTQVPTNGSNVHVLSTLLFEVAQILLQHWHSHESPEILQPLQYFEEMPRIPRLPTHLILGGVGLMLIRSYGGNVCVPLSPVPLLISGLEVLGRMRGREHDFLGAPLPITGFALLVEVDLLSHVLALLGVCLTA